MRFCVTFLRNEGWQSACQQGIRPGFDRSRGIAPQVLPYIFDAFFTTKEAGAGTGLGLCVVQNILVSHGGFIQVASTPGKGSTFSFYLPEGEHT